MGKRRQAKNPTKPWFSVDETDPELHHLVLGGERWVSGSPEPILRLKGLLNKDRANYHTLKTSFDKIRSEYGALQHELFQMRMSFGALSMANATQKRRLRALEAKIIKMKEQKVQDEEFSSRLKALLDKNGISWNEEKKSG